MKYNLSKRKIKLYSIYTINFILFILFARLSIFFIYKLFVPIYTFAVFLLVNIFSKLQINNFHLSLDNMLYAHFACYILFLQYIKLCFYIIFAKKIHLINFLDKTQFFFKIFYFIFIELLLFYKWNLFNIQNVYTLKPNAICIYMLFGTSFFATYIIYKLFKFISKTKVFCWIKYLYPKFLEKIPVICYQIFFVLIAYPLIKYYDNSFIYKGLSYWVFILSGKIFFVLIGIVLLFNIFKKVKHVLFKKRTNP